MVKTLNIVIFILIFNHVIYGRPPSSCSADDTLCYLNIPERSENAIGGSEFVAQVTNLSLDDREKAVVREILAGNVPSFSRKLRPLKIIQTINAKRYELVFFTVCDYMAIGSDQDYLYIPMTPSTAQYLSDKLKCTLPTKKMVDIIYAQAEVKLRPQPIPPSDKMTTVPVFWQHSDSIKQQIAQIGFDRSLNRIIAGNKKDIIISNKIYSPDRDYDRVVIYGWHLSENNPIQPVYNGHNARYADYSHGVRLISKAAFINGGSIQVDSILKDSNLWSLLSDEGVIGKPYYPESKIFTSVGARFKNPGTDFKLSQNYPNPFNPTTTITYQLTKSSEASIKIYNVLGRMVRTLVDERQMAGHYATIWDGKDDNGQLVVSGVYMYKIHTQDFEKTKKMILIR